MIAYDKPVMAEEATFIRGVRVAMPGGTETVDHASPAKRHAIEVLFRQRILRVWRTDHQGTAPVTTVGFENMLSLRLAGDTAETPVQGAGS